MKMVNKSDSTNQELVEKKRRKTTVTDSSVTKLSKDEIYTNAINFEEKEAVTRTPEEDADLYHKTCEELRQIFEEVIDLKKEAGEDAKAKIAEKRIEASLLFVKLKKLNRLDKIRVRSGREALHKEKQKVDSNLLQYQNLLYEADHLKKEIQRCYQFKSQDEEIELVPEEEFYEKAPEAITRPEKTKSDEHAKHIARLEWELQQRKELDAFRSNLQKSMETINQEIISKTDRLQSLAPKLQDLLAAAKPLQEALEMPIEKTWEFPKRARLLPQPLYLLYVNVTAYTEAYDQMISTAILGDEEEAKQLNDENGSNSMPENISEGLEQDSDNEDESEGVKKKRHRHTTVTSNVLEVKRENLIKPHPLSVTITVKMRDNRGALALNFFYLMQMGIVTTTCKLIDFETSGIAAGDVLAPENILNGLFNDDFGLASPNPKTKFQLQKHGIEMNEMLSMLMSKELGKPFKWTQKLCGLEFIADSGELPLNEVCQIPSVMKLIRNRLDARLKLYKQVLNLESGNIEASLPTDVVSIKISSNLLQWSAITFQEYLASNVSEKFIENGVASANDLYYRAIITRGSAKLECYICVSYNFPARQPFWALSLNWNGKHNAAIDSSVREMEFWVNSFDAAKHTKSVLAHQLRRAMTSLDIYLETEGPMVSPPEFTQDKNFIHSFRGRSRNRPYKALANSGSNVVFTQI